MSLAELKEERELKRLEREAIREMAIESKAKSEKKFTSDLNRPHRSSDVFTNAYEGKTEIVLEQIDKHPSLLTELGNLQANHYQHVIYAPSTVLHFACRGNRRELAFELVKRGADIHIRNHIGDTPLTGCDREFTEKLIKVWEHYQT